MVRSWLVAIAGCSIVAAVPAAALAAQVKLATTLVGANELAGGDPKGTGAFKVTIDAEAGDFCYSLAQTGLTDVTMAHVHSGAAGVNGPPVITIDLTDDECRAVDPAVLKQIVDSPASYYVNIHTAALPKGAIRGQLQAVK
jgi:CHRD domain